MKTNWIKKIKFFLKIWIKAVLLRILNRIRTNPRLRMAVTKMIAVLKLDPIARTLLRRLRMGAYSPVAESNNEDRLSPRARGIYLDLKQSIKRLHQEQH